MAATVTNPLAELDDEEFQALLDEARMVGIDPTDDGGLRRLVNSPAWQRVQSDLRARRAWRTLRDEVMRPFEWLLARLAGGR